MRQSSFWCITAAMLGMVALASGCGGGAPAPAGTGTSGGGHTHTHLGPHKGHVMVLGKEEYHAEWTLDEAAGKVTFYILDSEAKQDVPTDAKEITIDAKIGQNAPKTYTLAALNPQDGKSAAFELVDANLEGALRAKGAGTVCTLHVNINGKPFDEVIKEEEHTDDHSK